MIRRILKGVHRRLQKLAPNPNKRLKKSNWYHNQFPHLREYERLERNADVICIGSTPAKHAIDFKETKTVKGYNLAVCPETIFYDFQVLKNYHSYLKKGGTVLFVLCPFTFLKDRYRDELGSTSYLNIRYYPILHRAMIDTFDPKLYRKWVKNPFTISKKAFIRYFIDAKPTMPVWNNPDSPEESSRRCQERVKRWMQEFRMPDLDPRHIPKATETAIEGNIRIFQDMKDFVAERGYKAYIIIPPFPAEMTALLPQELVEHTLVRPIKLTGIPCLSYYNHKDWTDRSLFHHGFLLNATGCNLLTKDILSRIQV